MVYNQTFTLTKIMAASKAPHLTTITTTTSTTALNPLLTSNINSSTVSSFHDLCRSCGKKTNDELYDLFQQTTNLVTTATACATIAASPFNTSTTTCYAHLTNKPTTTLGTGERTSSAFDSVAATAKATAKGQSNMDNILQEMQIWQLMVSYCSLFMFFYFSIILFH